VNVKVDITGLSKLLLNTKKDLSKTVALSLNEIAAKVKVKEDSEIKSSLDRPTPFTQKAIFVRKAYQGRMTAIVQVRDIQAEYLKHVIKGYSSSQVKPLVFQKYRNKYGNAPRTITTKTVTRGDLILRKNKKNRTEIIGTWSHRREYKKMFNFFEIGEKEANRIKTSVFRKQVLLSLVRR
jgi:hypothetical protein